MTNTAKVYKKAMYVVGGCQWSKCSLSWRPTKPKQPTVNTSRPRQNGRHFPDDIFTYIFLNENVKTFIKISLKFVPKGPINNIPALVQIMAWRRPGDKSLSEPMLVSLPTHICVTRPQWVNKNSCFFVVNISISARTAGKFLSVQIWNPSTHAACEFSIQADWY